MIQTCKFNPDSDIEEVVPGLSVDVSEMMATHTVPATSAVDTPYTNETDINEVGHYLRDKIDIAMAQYRLNQKMSDGSQTPTTPSTESEKA